MTKEILKNEILSDKQLDTVSGGYESELTAIANALKMTDDLHPTAWLGSQLGNEYHIAKRLKKEFGIELKGDAYNTNTYIKGGKKLTHLEVMGVIRKKYPYQNIMDEILGTS